MWKEEEDNGQGKKEQNNTWKINTCFCVVGGEHVSVFWFSNGPQNRTSLNFSFCCVCSKNLILLHQNQISANLAVKFHTHIMFSVFHFHHFNVTKVQVCSLDLVSIYQIHLWSLFFLLPKNIFMKMKVWCFKRKKKRWKPDK